MMRLTRGIICALLGTLCLLSGCGKEASSSQPATKPAPTAAPTTVPVTTTAPAKPSTGDSKRENRRYNYLAIKQKSDAIYTKLGDIIDENHYQGAVYLKIGNDLEFSRSSGSSDEVKRKKNSLHTDFYTGSLTKHLTAAAVLKLQEEKKLSLSDKLEKYFKDCSCGKDVTIENLLTMTSGIPGYTEVSDDVNPKLTLAEALDKKITKKSTEKKNKSIILNWILSQKSTGKPGEAYAYSDSNYFLLGEIIEKASGTSYTSYINDNILKPLGMNSSGFRAPNSLATGYDDTDQEDNKLTYEGVGYSALGFISNISDTIRYVEGLFDERFINSDSLLLMHTAYKNGYGYGVQIDGGRISISSRIGAYSATVTYSTDESELYVAYSNYASSDSEALNALFKDYLEEFCF